MRITAIIYGLAIVLASIFIGNAYVGRAKTEGKIEVKGLGKTDFTSDLIVWEGNFYTSNRQMKNAYASLIENKKILKEYLKQKGVSENEIVFNAVAINKETKSTYSKEGKYTGEVFIGYHLTQSLKIESNEVDKIEKLSREITELINKGVQFNSYAPRYYYTKLADLKIEMISKATQDAQLRAKKIAEFSGGKLGKLKSAKMGVFQITGQYSNENYSWGGTFNTSSKEKTASITMKLVYKTK